MTTNPKHAAFGRPADPAETGTDQGAEGLSKLEYFTAAALTGVLAADTSGDLTYDRAASAAVKQARAVIKALNSEAET